jgi:hypothetical protein
MEASYLTLRGERAGQFASAFVDAKATEVKRSINKRGVRNIHRYEGDGFTKVAYERAAAYENSWLVVSVLVETVDDRTADIVVLVGGGGEGPFKLEEINMRRLVRGEESFGQAGRLVTVLEDVRDVCEELSLSVETRWESETEQSTIRRIEHKIFDT